MLHRLIRAAWKTGEGGGTPGRRDRFQNIGFRMQPEISGLPGGAPERYLFIRPAQRTES